ncbi:helix-turn-helix transcriptional regulator [Anaerotruncus rubiinfantis]|uniref:helix-turn-helix transcriptional regulator n=1 Tax=Anaerotruncus rubiinfantis TaxID=1720200 RepID=UPI0034A171DF
MKISKTKFELLMARKGLTVTKLCELSGISRQSIGAIRYRGTCTPITAAKLAAGLGVDVAEIVESD